MSVRPRLVAEAVEQRLQRADIFGGDRNVGALVAAEALEQRADCDCGTTPGWICITIPSSRLMRAISVSIWPRNSSASSDAEHVPARTLAYSASRIRSGKVRGARGRVAVIGRRSRRASRKKARRFAMRAQIAGEARDVLAGRSRRSGARFAAKSAIFRVDHRIRPIGGDHPSFPAALADRAMVRRADRAGFRSSRAPRC